MRIVKDVQVYGSFIPISNVGGDFSDLSLFVFWEQCGITYSRTKFKNYVIDNNGIYRGSINSGRWSGITQFLTDGKNPSIQMQNSKPALVLWEKDGKLYAAPSTLMDEIISAQTTIKADLESDFAVELANDGRFTAKDTPYAEMFSNEKTVAIEMGYGDELYRMATCQIESVNASRDNNGGMLMVNARNKYTDLLSLPMTKTFGPKYPAKPKEIVIEGFQVDKPIPPRQVVEVRIDAPAPVRWYPESMELTNIVVTGDSPGQVTISRVYGQTEIMGFVLVANQSDSDVTVSFDVLAATNTDAASAVSFTEQIRNEEIKLSGTTPTRLTKKSVDVELNRRIVVTNQDGSLTYIAFDEDNPDAWWDYKAELDEDGYTTIVRNPSGNISDGQTVKITYEYAVGTSGKLTIKGGTNTAYSVLLFADEWEPRSLQIRITGVSGGGTDGSLETYKEKYAPVHVLFSPSVNGAGMQVLLTKAHATSDLTITYEIWARQYKDKLAKYWSAADVIRDIVKLATYKDLKIGEHRGKLDAGQFSDTIFIAMEESIDPETVRVENSGTDDVQISLIAAGYIPDDDGGETWGVRVAVTRTMPTGLEQDYSFQIWGQFIGRTDFFYPLDLVMPELPDTVFDRTLQIVDQSIEDALNKVLQISFADDRAKFKMMFGGNGELIIRPYRLEAQVDTFTAANMASISKQTGTPQIYDRVQIKGAMTPSYLVTTKKVLLHDQSGEPLAGPKWISDIYFDFKFDQEIRPESLELEIIWLKKATLTIHKRSTSGCTLRMHNTSDGDYRTPKAQFKLWGVPLTSVVYQEDYVYKTEPGVGGKYRNPTAVVENEMIMSQQMADLVGSSIVIESTNGANVWKPGEMPFNPAVEPLDTVMGEFTELDVNARGIVEEMDVTYDTRGTPELYMNLSIKPYDRFAAGFGFVSLWMDADDSLSTNYELHAKDNVKKLLNLLFR